MQPNGPKGCTVLINRHKTAHKYLSAAFSFDDETGPLLSAYVNLRSLMMKDNSSNSDFFYCTQKGTLMHTSHVNQVLTNAYGKAGFKHTVSANKLRYKATTAMALKAPDKHVLCNVCADTASSTRSSGNKN